MVASRFSYYFFLYLTSTSWKCPLILSLSNDGVMLWKEAWRLEFFTYNRIMVLELWHLRRLNGLSYLLENSGNKLEGGGEENYEHKS